MDKKILVKNTEGLKKLLALQKKYIHKLILQWGVNFSESKC